MPREYGEYSEHDASNNIKHSDSCQTSDKQAVVLQSERRKSSKPAAEPGAEKQPPLVSPIAKPAQRARQDANQKTSGNIHRERSPRNDLIKMGVNQPDRNIPGDASEKAPQSDEYNTRKIHCQNLVKLCLDQVRRAPKQ